MPLTAGCNHVTILTGDLDRLIAFYCGVFDADVRLDMTEEDLRHALIDLGGGFFLHPFQLARPAPYLAGMPRMFTRGHIDHFGLDLPDRTAFETARRRLVEVGATAGRVRDFGSVEVLGFEDPDGMEVEITLWKGGPHLTMAESRVSAFEAA
jgi:catechol 2,3-dioxygenase-like lactoylglutathione lyase family enzyme